MGGGGKGKKGGGKSFMERQRMMQILNAAKGVQPRTYPLDQEIEEMIERHRENGAHWHVINNKTQLHYYSEHKDFCKQNYHYVNREGRQLMVEKQKAAATVSNATTLDGMPSRDEGSMMSVATISSEDLQKAMSGNSGNQGMGGGAAGMGKLGASKINAARHYFQYMQSQNLFAPAEFFPVELFASSDLKKKEPSKDKMEDSGSESGEEEKDGSDDEDSDDEAGSDSDSVQSDQGDIGDEDYVEGFIDHDADDMGENDYDGGGGGGDEYD